MAETELPPLSDDDLQALERHLEHVPAPLEPLDVMALDGFLVGVLLQPRPVPKARWLPHVTDVEGRALPAGYDPRALHDLVLRRHAELNRAIHLRQWFDPWVFELESDDDEADPLETILPWVAGFATAMDVFPEVMNEAGPEVLEPLAVLYRAFDPDDLEDADELLEIIEELEPPEDLAEAVESLVTSTLLLADVTRPQTKAPPKPAAPRRAVAPPQAGRGSNPPARQPQGAPSAGRAGAPSSARPGGPSGKPNKPTKPGGGPKR